MLMKIGATCACALALPLFAISLSSAAEVEQSGAPVNVQHNAVQHNVEVLGATGPQGQPLKTYYNCWSNGCEVVAEDKLQLPTKRVEVEGKGPRAASVTVGAGD